MRSSDTAATGLCLYCFALDPMQSVVCWGLGQVSGEIQHNVGHAYAGINRLGGCVNIVAVTQSTVGGADKGIKRE